MYCFWNLYCLKSQIWETKPLNTATTGSHKYAVFFDPIQRQFYVQTILGAPHGSLHAISPLVVLKFSACPRLLRRCATAIGTPVGTRIACLRAPKAGDDPRVLV